jgi:hypothetical protein
VKSFLYSKHFIFLRVIKAVKKPYLYFLFLWAPSLFAEPWINTNELYLRSDIELLADAGIIHVPITTYPLMWSGIIKDLDKIKEQRILSPYRSAYWRIKKAYRSAFLNQQHQQLQIVSNNSEPLFRGFGDTLRGKLALKASAHKIHSHLAWKLNVIRSYRTKNTKKVSYEGSYISTTFKNWVLKIGSIEQWWGASWDSSNILSNNALAPLGVFLNRNYSDPPNFFLLNWIGYWNVSTFYARLSESENEISKAFTGLSFSMKPIESLEISARATKLFAHSFIKPFKKTVDQKKIIHEQKRIATDLRWRLPYLTSFGVPSHLYTQFAYDAKKEQTHRIFGVSTMLLLSNQQWRFYAEYSDSQRYSYRSSNFQSTSSYFPYHYRNRSLASSYEPQSRVKTFGFIGHIGSNHTLELKMQSLMLNQSNNKISFFNASHQKHLLSSRSSSLRRWTFNWNTKMNRYHHLNYKIEVSDPLLNAFHPQKERYRLQLGWVYDLN